VKTLFVRSTVDLIDHGLIGGRRRLRQLHDLDSLQDAVPEPGRGDPSRRLYRHIESIQRARRLKHDLDIDATPNPSKLELDNVVAQAQRGGDDLDQSIPRWCRSDRKSKRSLCRLRHCDQTCLTLGRSCSWT
jgi:hypothetical protein